MKPTDEQIKEFWEWCGFKQTENQKKTTWYMSPWGEIMKLPPIDPNNLFHWVVPKLSNYNMCKGLEPGKPVFGQHVAEVWSLTHGYGKAYSEDPALASSGQYGR